MAKAKQAIRQCSKCYQPAMEDRNECKEHFAEYMREYRQRSDRKRDQANHFRGFEEGVTAALVFLRTKIASQPVTGFQAAAMIERGYLTPETPGVAERARLIAMVSPY